MLRLASITLGLPSTPPTAPPDTQPDPIAVTPACIQTWGPRPVRQAFGSTHRVVAQAALNTLPGLFYTPNRLLLTVGVRLASITGSLRADPRMRPLHFPGAVVLGRLSASA
jgi:hypothetical protein